MRISHVNAKYEILQFYPNGHLFFYSEIQNLELFPNGHSLFFITKHKILKFVPKRPFVSQNEIDNLESCTQTANSHFP